MDVVSSYMAFSEFIFNILFVNVVPSINMREGFVTKIEKVRKREDEK